MQDLARFNRDLRGRSSFNKFQQFAREPDAKLRAVSFGRISDRPSDSGSNVTRDAISCLCVGERRELRMKSFPRRVRAG